MQRWGPFQTCEVALVASFLGLLAPVQEVISSSQNVAVSYVGDGPLLDLTFKFTRVDGSHVDVAVTDFTGASYASLSGVVVANGAGNGILASGGFTQAAVKEVRALLGLPLQQYRAFLNKFLPISKLTWCVCVLHRHPRCDSRLVWRTARRRRRSL